MSLKVSFKVGEENTIMIPDAAIVHRGELTMVYVKQGDKQLPRQIRTGQQNNNMTEVISGLMPGDIIALNPLATPVKNNP
jgi:multidrug efflux pump subunit AcrA (membrane-fusion protein)